MRKLFIFALLSSCSSVSRHSAWDGRVEKILRPPVCVSAGTHLEGWLFENGSVKRERCLNMVAYCDRVGTTTEGWYAAEVGSRQRILSEKCSKFQNHRPECTAVDSFAEGWTSSAWAGSRVLWDSCRHKVVVCDQVGTEHEGWFALMPKVETALPLQQVKCGELLIRSSYYR